MTLETSADRLAYVQAFGEPVRCESGTFIAIFDNAYLGVSAGDLDVEESGPRLACVTADVMRLAIRKETVLTVSDMDWRVVRIEHDGTGMSVIFLRE